MTERGDLRLPPRRYSKTWLAFAKVVERTSALLGGRAFYRRWFLSPGRFRIREECVAVENLPPGLNDFSILQLSDLHGGRFMGEGDLNFVIDAALAQEPDLIVLTGDYVIHHWREMLGLVTELKRLRATHGVLAVLGNHDYRGRNEQHIIDHFEEIGIQTLRNECVRIDTGNGVLAVVGLEDLEEAKVVDEKAARLEVRADDVELVLCHNPHMSKALARKQCAAVLSGHTHGNQIDLPGFRTLGPHHPGERCEFGNTVAITNLGLGAIGLPFRFGAPAEMVRLTFRDLCAQ
ncbi:MAG: putative MPP superfamily phosphohydrolase [Planctomycetota bacterium]|jgi:predicted MPP superfamily phosphohydrolase